MKNNKRYLILVCAAITNIYLIFYWEPQNKVINQDQISKEAISYTKSVYKLDKANVLSQLSANDKKDFERIIKKLSTFDIGKIKEYYEYSNEEEGVTNIFRLLKKRLITEDYIRIRKISYLILDLEKIDEIIKNN